MIHTVAGNGSRGFRGDGGLATNAQLYRPSGVAVSSSGEVYIADASGHTIRKVSPNGLISTIAGNGVKGFGGDGGLSTKAQLCNPVGIAVSESGGIYIADTHNHRIRKISPNGLISTIAGNGSGGFSGDGGLATNAQLFSPQGIAVSESGEIYIADTGNHRIRKIALNGLISTIAGNGRNGFSGDGGEATNARLCSPCGIAVGSNGEIYIADLGNHRIRKISKHGSISTIAGGDCTGLSGDGGLAIHAQLFSPDGIALSESGDIYIADRDNHRIRKISKHGLISTIAGGDCTGLSGDGGLATNAQLKCPSGIAVTSNGDIYISDQGNCRIRKIDGLCFNDPIMSARLKKYERDHALDGLVYFRPLLAKLAPTFYKTILSTNTLLSFDANEKQIVQHLIDSFMYGTELDLDGLESTTVVSWLFVLGMTEGGEFFEVETSLLTKFVSALTSDSMPVILERLDTLKERSTTKNRLLSQMIDYTLGRAALLLRSSPTLCTNPVIQKHLVQIVPKMSQTEIAPITLTETIREETGGIQSLFNDSATSDIKILLGEKLFYCHRTILSSYSPYLEVLFSNSESFNDLEGGTYRVDRTDFREELHEVIIKYCYNLIDKSAISDSMIIPLFKCASFYGMTQLAEYCVHGISPNTGNYFELIEQLGEYPCEALCTKLVEFGFANLKSLNITEEKLDSLPEQVQKKLLWKFMQATK